MILNDFDQSHIQKVLTSNVIREFNQSCTRKLLVSRIMRGNCYFLYNSEGKDYIGRLQKSHKVLCEL